MKCSPYNCVRMVTAVFEDVYMQTSVRIHREIWMDQLAPMLFACPLIVKDYLGKELNS